MFICGQESSVGNRLKGLVWLGVIASIALGITYIAVAQENAPRESAQPGPNQKVEGQVPPDWHPGSGTIITGDEAERAQAGALSRYPGGTANRVLKLSDGSYLVHMIKIKHAIGSPSIARSRRAAWDNIVLGVPTILN